MMVISVLRAIDMIKDSGTNWVSNSIRETYHHFQFVVSPGYTQAAKCTTDTKISVDMMRMVLNPEEESCRFMRKPLSPFYGT